MNPLFLAASITGAILGLKRACPVCKKDQIVHSSEKNSAVRCKHCGAMIPPKK